MFLSYSLSRSIYKTSTKKHVCFATTLTQLTNSLIKWTISYRMWVDEGTHERNIMLVNLLESYTISINTVLLTYNRIQSDPKQITNIQINEIKKRRTCPVTCYIVKLIQYNYLIIYKSYNIKILHGTIHQLNNKSLSYIFNN